MSALARLLAVACVLLPCAAQAAGLGQLNVLSTLGQPFQAEIEVLSVRKEDVNTLLARIAAPDAYRRANIEYGAVLRGMSVSIMQRPNGQPYIRASTSNAVNEPIVNLLIELDGPSGRFVREYSALLDPPGYAMAPQPAAPATAEAPPAPAPRASAAATAAPAVTPAPRAAAPGGGTEYGPIKRGETLSRIAASVKPEGVSLDQMLVGLLRANPDAFINNNINRLKAGAMLRIPDKDQLAGVPQDKARQDVRVQTADWNRYRRRVADSAGRATEQSSTGGKPVSVRVKEGDDKAGKDVLKLSTGEPAGAKAKDPVQRIQNLEEELIARDRALNEANARIKELENAVKGSGAKK